MGLISDSVEAFTVTDDLHGSSLQVRFHLSIKHVHRRFTTFDFHTKLCPEVDHFHTRCQESETDGRRWNMDGDLSIEAPSLPCAHEIDFGRVFDQDGRTAEEVELQTPRDKFQPPWP